MSTLRKSGGYRQLASFQVATTIYDATYWFCERFLDSRSRTVDQMVQAARSGRQNIAEGSRAAAISSQTELRLVNVARASLEELLFESSRSNVSSLLKVVTANNLLQRGWLSAFSIGQIRQISPIRLIQLRIASVAASQWY